MTSSIYLDNAATSFPKPEAVCDAVSSYLRNNGRPVGRGTSDAAQELARIVDRCRLRAARLFDVPDHRQIVFTLNCTDSLNTVLHGLLQPGDHAVTTVSEHNSVLRPLRHLERTRGITVTTVDVNEAGFFDPASVTAAIRPETRLVAVQHVSNVTGAIQAVADVGAITQERGVRLLVDAAQSAGHVPFRIPDLNADFVACSGHKGLLGPLGTGLLWLEAGRELEVEPFRQGGTGSRSELDIQPETMPDRYEAGNHNAPGIVGLDAALGFLTERGIDTIQRHEQELAGRLCDGLRTIPGLHLVDSGDRQRHTGIVSLRSELLPSDELATVLSQHFHIDTRAGLHCAPGMHRRLGTLEHQGTVRLSTGWATTRDDVDAAVDALRQISGAV